MSPSRPDRGERVVRDQIERRYLDPQALRDDIAVLMSRTARSSARIAAFPPGSRVAERLAQGLDRRVESLGDLVRRRGHYERTGLVLDGQDIERVPIGARVRSLGARGLPAGEEVVVSSYRRGRARAWDRAAVRLADGSEVTVPSGALELIERPAAAG